MAKPNRTSARIFAAVVLLVAVAVVCRFISYAGYYDRPLSLLRTAIYMGLFAAWGFSVRRRIIQTQVRRYFAAVAGLMLLWMLFRSMKYYVVSAEEQPDLTRMLWYLYYLPMLFIPLLAAFIAMSLGKPENYRLPKWTALLYIPTAVLLLLVLTNDLHQLVFAFPEDAAVWSDRDTSYGPCYPFIIGWETVCGVFAFGLMLTRCRVPRSKKVLLVPLLPIAAALIYGVIYATGANWLRVVAGDMTVMFCLLFAATLESCIQCGLIQSNTRYGDLLACCTMRVRITDEDYNTLSASSSAKHIPVETLRQTEAGPVQLEDGTRLSGAKIRGGHVLWTEDVAELLGVLNELGEAKENLEDGNSLLQEEYKLRAREAHIAEQDRLYNIIQRDTARQISLLVELTDEFENTEDEAEQKKLLGKMIVIGAYLKRRNNLIFLADKTPVLSERELALTFGESMSNLELYGVSCGFVSAAEGPVEARQLMAIYDFFENIVERSLDSMSAVTVRIKREENALSITVNTDSAADLSCLAGENAEAERDEDGEWRLSLLAPSGGETL